MAQAIWNGVVLAESDRYEVVDGNLYFPADSLKMDYFQPSTHTSVCGWKGTASYYTIVVNEQTNQNAAWYYPDPKAAAANLKNHVAFWKGVQVSR